MKLLVGLCVAVVLSGIWLVGTFRNRSQLTEARQYIDAIAGDTLCRPDHRAWADPGSQALIIVGSATCSACLASKSFEQDLDDYGAAHGMPVFYVLSSDHKNDEEAGELKTAGKHVLRETLQDFGITRIPAFLRVNDRGIIQAKWIDTVPDPVRGFVFQSLVSGQIRGYERISAVELPPYLDSPRYQILALSRIGQERKGRAAVIPVSELAVRARYELDPLADTVVDCGSSLSSYQCQFAALVLTQLNFKRVIAAGLPLRRADCR